jgi:hypothetical protein
MEENMAKNKAEMAKWICTTKCYYNKCRWTPGDGKILVAAEAPPTFEKLGSTSSETNPEDMSVDERRTAIRAALVKMDKDDEKLWTKDKGLPLVGVVGSMTGFDTDREEVENAFPGFDRDVKTLGGVKGDVFLD